MVVRRYDNIVAQQGRKRKDGSRSRTYYYRVRQKGAKPLWVRMMGVPGDVEFEAQYRKLVQPEDLRGSPFSFRVLIGSYRDSSRYRQLSDRSKKDRLQRCDGPDWRVARRDGRQPLSEARSHSDAR